MYRRSLFFGEEKERRGLGMESRSKPIPSKTEGECIVICVDNSEWMRAEDYVPSRWRAQIDAISQWLSTVESSPQRSKNHLAVVSIAGSRPNCHISPTLDISRLMRALEEIQIEGECDHITALKLAQMVVRNRPNKQQAGRVVWFLGGPLPEDHDILCDLARAYKKSQIGVDIISFGEISRVRAMKLDSFINYVNRQENSHAVFCTSEEQLSMKLMHLMSSRTAFRPTDSGLESPDREIEEATQRAEALGMAVLPLSSNDRPQCRKTVLDKMRYKCITRHVSIPVSICFKDRKVVVVVPSPRNTKKLIGSFKAGRMFLEPETNVVSADDKKGEISLWMTGDSMLVFQWKNRTSGTIDLNLTLSPGLVEWHVVDNCDTGKVYLLQLRSKNSFLVTRHFFWSQEPSTGVASSEFWFLMRQQIKNYQNQPEYPPIGDIELQSLDREAILESLDLHRFFGLRRGDAQLVSAPLFYQHSRSKLNSQDENSRKPFGEMMVDFDGKKKREYRRERFNLLADMFSRKSSTSTHSQLEDDLDFDDYFGDLTGMSRSAFLELSKKMKERGLGPFNLNSSSILKRDKWENLSAKGRIVAQSERKSSAQPTTGIAAIPVGKEEMEPLVAPLSPVARIPADVEKDAIAPSPSSDVYEDDDETD
eukprot:TRINITY_DN1345_c0_g1_i3.p1 TRINITY_DN1345_c0_g1~~TRINITY_DN1345_c0_g1_i3.p1  ORF type:complete len:650 (+),score=144.15 TRINITY_DN1345_c0_g1_i3:147-2096(+)